MGYRDRRDGIGVWHNTTNRGVGKRSIFENEQDIRQFLSRIARICRMGILEVHAYSIMLNHFHLLVRSPVGELSRAMRLIQNPYSRWFNRKRRRDGPLFRGRFRSRAVESEVHWWAALRYIDYNAVDAGIVDDPVEYPHGSARHYFRSSRGPLWLTRDVVEGAVIGASDKPYDPRRYPFAIAPRPTPEEREIVERRLLSLWLGKDPLDDLYLAAPESVKSWQRAKAANADGTEPGLPLVSATTIQRLIIGRCNSTEGLFVRPRGRNLSGWPILLAGLLRSVCGCSLGEIAGRAGIAVSTAHEKVRDHAALLLTNEAYAGVAAGILADAIEADHAAMRGVGLGKGNLIRVPGR